MGFFFFKQKTAYEMRISDWSSDVCSSDLLDHPPSSQQILLVEIDNESLQRIGRWPWSRETHAALNNQIAKAKPKAIAYDVLFAEPGAEDEDRRSGEDIAAEHTVFLPLFPNTTGLSGPPVAMIETIHPVTTAAAQTGPVTP